MSNNSIKKIGIVGNGKMGTDIFNYLFDLYPLSLVWICKDKEEVDGLNKFVIKKLKKMAYSGIDDEKIKMREEKISASSDINELSDCDLIIEAIFEDIDAKQSLITALNDISHDKLIIASNTSSLPLHKIFENYGNKTNTLGLHFFYPIAYKDIVEINYYTKTNTDTINKIKEFCDAIKRQYLLLDESNNFALNKMFSPFMAITFFLLKKYDLAVHSLDNVIKENLFSFGIFEMIDSVGIDIILTSVKNYYKNYEENVYLKSWINEMTVLVEKGYLGVKNKKGFYEYNTSHNEMTGKQKTIILDELNALFINSFLNELDNNYCSPDKLNNIFIEYLGLKTGPLEMLKEIGRDNVYKILHEYYTKTKNVFFKPNMLIKQ